MKNVDGVDAREVFWAASDVGRVVGHSYIVYGPLRNGNTAILFEGKPVGTPDAGGSWCVIAQHGVEVMFTAPTAFRAIKKEDPEGERVAGYTLRWAQSKPGVPVIDHGLQTEAGWPLCANCLGIDHLRSASWSSRPG
jgi:propionyl-CoA synthetase